MSLLTDEIFKLSFAIVVGGLIGAEREFRHRAAGFRTIIFICLGSTLFTMFSLELGGDVSPVRIAAHMVTGVGFLCAGVILEEKSRIVGLTTSSTIWFTAAMGLGIGGGQYRIVVLALLGSMVILWVFPKIEELIYNMRERRKYEIVFEIDCAMVDDVDDIFESCGLMVQEHKQEKHEDEMVCVITAYGPPKNHERVIEKLLAETEVKEFRY